MTVQGTHLEKKTLKLFPAEVISAISTGHFTAEHLRRLNCKERGTKRLWVISYELHQND